MKVKAYTASPNYQPIIGSSKRFSPPLVAHCAHVLAVDGMLSTTVLEKRGMTETGFDSLLPPAKRTKICHADPLLQDIYGHLKVVDEVERERKARQAAETAHQDCDATVCHPVERIGPCTDGKQIKSLQNTISHQDEAFKSQSIVHHTTVEGLENDKRSAENALSDERDAHKKTQQEFNAAKTIATTQ